MSCLYSLLLCACLLQAGQGKVGTDEIEFIRILCSRNYRQLFATFEAYEKISDNDIEVAIHKEFSGDLRRALLAIGKCSRTRASHNNNNNNNNNSPIILSF